MLWCLLDIGFMCLAITFNSAHGEIVLHQQQNLHLLQVWEVIKKSPDNITGSVY